MLRERDVALVIGDHPERPFQMHEMTADWTLVRLHYGVPGRRGNYSETELDRWAERISGWRERSEVFVYFNNWEGFAVRNAEGLAQRLGGGAVCARGEGVGRTQGTGGLLDELTRARVADLEPAP